MVPEPVIIEEVKNIGWLRYESDYPTGRVDDTFILKLKDILASPRTNINKTRGIHTCEFCDKELGYIWHSITHQDNKLPLGTSEIWIPSAHSIIYAAPTLIYHYIVEHLYQPPTEFIEAVRQFDLDSDWNGQEIYHRLVKKYRAQ